MERSLHNSAFAEGPFNREGMFAGIGLNEEITLRRMLFQEKCIVKRGYFPDTTEGISDRFCFVNLDMDLFQPMLAGLRYFYERMCVGGVILLHDYFHPQLPGVKQAVEAFEQESGRVLSKLPIGDFCSIAIIKN